MPESLLAADNLINDNGLCYRYCSTRVLSVHGNVNNNDVDMDIVQRSPPLISLSFFPLRSADWISTVIPYGSWGPFDPPTLPVPINPVCLGMASVLLCLSSSLWPYKRSQHVGTGTAIQDGRIQSKQWKPRKWTSESFDPLIGWRVLHACRVVSCLLLSLSFSSRKHTMAADEENRFRWSKCCREFFDTGLYGYIIKPWRGCCR